MNHKVIRILSLCLAVALAVGVLLGTDLTTPVAAAITEEDLTYGIQAELAIDFTGTTAVVGAPTGYPGSSSYSTFCNTAYRDGVLTVNFTNGLFADQTVTHVVNVTLNQSLVAYTYTSAFTDNTVIPLFVLSDGTVCGVATQSFGGCYYGYCPAGTDSWTNITDKFFAGFGDSFHSTDKVTVDVSYDSMDACTKVSLKILKNGVLITSQTLDLSDFTGQASIDDDATVLTDHLAARFTTIPTSASCEERMDTLEFKTIGEDKTSVVEWINAHPILIELQNGAEAKSLHTAEGIAKASAALTDFASLETENPALAEAVEKNGYYSDAIEEALTVIQDTPMGGIFLEDVTVDHMAEGALDLTGTTAEIYHPSEINGWNYYWTYHSTGSDDTKPVYKDGNFSVTFHPDFASNSWDCNHTLDITLNQPVTSYTVEGVFQQGSRIPLFKGSDGNYYSLQSMADYNNFYQFGTMDSFTSGNASGSGNAVSDGELSAAFSEDTVKIKVSYTYTGTDATGLTLEIIHKETDAVKWSKGIAFPVGVTALTDHLLADIPGTVAGIESYEVQAWGTYADNRQVVDFVNAHLILNEMKQDDNFKTDTYLTSENLPKVEAAKTAHDQLPESLQASLAANGYYDAERIAQILMQDQVDDFLTDHPILVTIKAADPFRAGDFAESLSEVEAAKQAYTASAPELQQALADMGYYDLAKISAILLQDQVDAFVQQHSVLTEIQADTAFDPANYQSRLTEVEAARSAYAQESPDLQDALAAQGFYDGGKLEQILMYKDVHTVETALAAVKAKYLQSASYAVTEANAAQVSAELSQAMDAFGSMTPAQQNLAQQNGYYDSGTFTALYYAAQVRLTGSFQADLTKEAFRIFLDTSVADAYVPGSNAKIGYTSILENGAWITTTDENAGAATATTIAQMTRGIRFHVPAYTEIGLQDASITVSFQWNTATKPGVGFCLGGQYSRVYLMDPVVSQEPNGNGKYDIFATVQMPCEAPWADPMTWTTTVGETDTPQLPTEFTTYALRFTFQVAKWLNGDGLMPKWLVTNTVTQESESLWDISNNQLKAAPESSENFFYLDQDAVNPKFTVTDISAIYYQSGKLAYPSMMGATVKKDADPLKGALRFESHLTGLMNTGLYEPVEYGTVYIPAEFLPQGTALSYDMVGEAADQAKVYAFADAEMLPDGQKFFAWLDGENQEGFVLTEYVARSYIRYRVKLTGQILTLYSGNTGNSIADGFASHGNICRSVYSTSIRIYERHLKELTLEDEAFVAARASLENVLAGNGTDDAKFDALMRFLTRFKDYISNDDAL